MASSRARWTSRSFSASRALVASSSSRIGASRTRARAMARRWRWPPERRRGAVAHRRVEALRQGVEEALGLGGPGGGADLGVAGVLAAEADVVRRPSRRTAASPGPPAPCGRAPRPGSASRRSTPSSGTVPAWRVVEAQQQPEDGALAGARGADQGHALAGPHVQGEALQGRQVGAARIGEGHPLEGDRSPRGGSGRGVGLGGRGDRRARRRAARRSAPWRRRPSARRPRSRPARRTEPAAITARKANWKRAPQRHLAATAPA